MLQSPLYIIDAFWDIESGVWVATSDDVLGLATEAPTIEQLTQKLHIMIPELIQVNQLLPENYQGAIGFELISYAIAKCFCKRIAGYLDEEALSFVDCQPRLD